nr:isoform 2 of elongation factor 1-gamma 2 [Quercus suber]
MLREEKWLLHLEIAEQIVYLLFLVVILRFALRLRKCKHNNSNSGGQTPASVSIADNDSVGVPNINAQITIDPSYPTCLAILHAANTNTNALKILIVAEYSGVKVELDPNFEMNVTNKTPEFLKLNPIGKVPVLETPDGPIFESNAIARYLTRLKPDNTLFGSSLIDYGHIEQWLEFTSVEIYGNIVIWFKPRDGRAVYLPQVEEAAISGLKTALRALNTNLASNTYLVGHFVTLVDIAPKDEAEKEEPRKPKTEVGEEEEAPKPKPKNPLDLLPPCNMILDEWKRLYSNTKTNFCEVAIKGFWDMYDPEGYSLWFCDYKYNDENTVSFVTLNKGGFLQRMDLALKYAFGKTLMIGSEPPFKVKGLWLFRGPEIPQFVLDECYDMELYDWKKVDIIDEDQKERVNQMIEDNEPFEGKPLFDAKCFR